MELCELGLRMSAVEQGTPGVVYIKGVFIQRSYDINLAQI